MHAWSFVIIKLEACNKLRLRKLRNIFRYICLSKDKEFECDHLTNPCICNNLHHSFVL